MKWLRKIRRRFFEERVVIKISDDELAFMLQMGWAEQVFGAYIMTDRGTEEMYALVNKMKKENK